MVTKNSINKQPDQSNSKKVKKAGRAAIGYGQRASHCFDDVKIEWHFYPYKTGCRLISVIQPDCCCVKSLLVKALQEWIL